jgi:putative aminopeptidase FrvX
VELIAAVILLSCSPTFGIAVVFSTREEEGERGASVASGMFVSYGV